MEASDSQLDAEMEKLRSSYASKKVPRDCPDGTTTVKSKISGYVAFCSRRDVQRPLMIMFVLFLLQQFCGLSTISFYAVNVLAASNSSVDEVISPDYFLSAQYIRAHREKS